MGDAPIGDSSADSGRKAPTPTKEVTEPTGGAPASTNESLAPSDEGSTPPGERPVSSDEAPVPSDVEQAPRAEAPATTPGPSAGESGPSAAAPAATPAPAAEAPARTPAPSTQAPTTTHAPSAATPAPADAPDHRVTSPITNGAGGATSLGGTPETSLSEGFADGVAPPSIGSVATSLHGAAPPPSIPCGAPVSPIPAPMGVTATSATNAIVSVRESAVVATKADKPSLLSRISGWFVPRLIHKILRMCFIECSVQEVADRKQEHTPPTPADRLDTKVLETALDVAWRVNDQDAARQSAVDEKVKWLFALIVIVGTFTAGVVELDSSKYVLASGAAAVAVLSVAGWLTVWYFGVKNSANASLESSGLLNAPEAEAKQQVLDHLRRVSAFNGARTRFDVDVYRASLRLVAIGALAVIFTFGARLFTEQDDLAAKLRGDPKLLRELRGPQGDPGKDGADGKDGPPGKDGQEGAMGPAGPKGDSGPAGTCNCSPVTGAAPSTPPVLDATP
jgi:hypothetical protein